MPATSPTYPEHQCQINGTPYYYLEAGQGPSTLILVHGSLSDYRYWRWQMPAFQTYGRTIAPSLRGYWPTAFNEPDPSFSVQQHTLDLKALIETISPNQAVHLLGHSRGALVAMELAELMPEKIRSLTLADPGFYSSSLPASHHFQTQAAEKLKNQEIENGLALFIDAVSGDGTWEKMTGWFKTMVQDNAMTLLSQVAETEQEYDLNRVPKIKCPTLLLGGANSPPRYQHILDLMELLLPNAKRTTIPLATHGMNLANPKAFNRAAIAFWNDVDKAPER